jgi:hypothetical protein
MKAIRARKRGRREQNVGSLHGQGGAAPTDVYNKVGCAPHFARCHAAQDLRSIGTSAMFGKKQHVFRLADDPGC